MIIDEDTDSDDDAGGARAQEDVEGTAYREAITSADGFTRGPNGRIKFNKDTKKRRRENRDEGDGDVEMGDADGKTAARPGKKRTEDKLGREFKAKVSLLNARSVVSICLMLTIYLAFQKAGGDVKKGGVDPYAYLPLSQAAKKGAKHSRLGVAGKR